MGYDERREIFERLEALERQARNGHGRGGRDDDRHGGRDRGHGHHRDCDHQHHDGHDRRGDHHHDDHDHREGGGDFDEKRIIDTIVHLVAERIERTLESRQESERDGDGFDERRIVDLIVGLVSEHVQEIVATELDRRLGPPAESASPPSGGPPAKE